MFFEDDVSFDAVKYWDFTWEEFFNKLPDHWECVQLCLLSDDRSRIIEILNRNSVFKRDWDYWSVCAYLMKRSHAKKLIDTYFPEGIFYLDYKGWDRELRSKYNNSRFNLPTAETIIYTLFRDTKENQTILSFPLFLENIEFNTTWNPGDGRIGDPYHIPRIFSRNLTDDWWKSTGSNLTIDEIYMNI